MGLPEEVPAELLDGYYQRQLANGGFVDKLFPVHGLEESRKADIADTFSKFRGSIQELLESMGIERPEVIDHVTMYVSIQERSGFESGIKFVHDNAHVTSRHEARRQASVAHSFKTAGI